MRQQIKFFVVVLHLFCNCSIWGQQGVWYPKNEITSICKLCHGNGFYIYKCGVCRGTGYVTNDKFIKNNVKAYCMLHEAQYALCKKNYDYAYLLFSDLYTNSDKHTNVAESAYWMGICYELGFGVRVNRDKAWEFYNFSQRNGFHKAAYEINRINSNGFYVANEHQRKEYLQRLATEKNMEYMQTSINYQMSKENEKTINEMIEDRRQERSNETRFCPQCKGTGTYSNPNEKYFSSGLYMCKNCGKKQSYGYHHSCVCKRCGGSGNVRR